MLLNQLLQICFFLILSYYSSLNQGQDITIPPGTPIVSCGEYDFLDPGGSIPISSPNYPNDYPNSAHCVWIIICSKAGSPIELQFLNFSIPASPDCKNDSVLIRDGLRSNATVLGHLCGPSIRRTFLSSQNNVRMEFNSDSNITSTGFNMLAICRTNETTPTTQPPPTTIPGALPPGSVIISCGEYDFIGPGGSVNITSPDYPANYANNQRCRYAIICSASASPLTLRILDFDLQQATNCSKDVLILRDGLRSNSTLMAHLCGVNPAKTVYTTTRGELRVEFDADATINRKGFKAEISCPESTTPAASTISTTSTAEPTTTSTAEPTTTSASTENPTTASTSTEKPTTTSASTAKPTTTSASTAKPTTTSASTMKPTTSANISTTRSPWKASRYCRN